MAPPEDGWLTTNDGEAAAESGCLREKFDWFFCPSVINRTVTSGEPRNRRAGAVAAYGCGGGKYFLGNNFKVRGRYGGFGLDDRALAA